MSLRNTLRPQAHTPDQAPAAASALPASATSTGLVLSGLASLLLACWALFGWQLLGPLHSGLASAWATLVLILATGGGMTAHALLVCRSHRASLTAPRRPSGSQALARLLRKWLGLHMVLAALAAVYWLLQEYHGPLYRPFFQVAGPLLPVFSLLALPYIAWVDARMAAPHDAYWQLGDALMRLSRPGPLESNEATQASETTGATGVSTGAQAWRGFALGWVVKGFFLPLMFGYAVRNVQALAGMHLLDGPVPPRLWFDWALTTLYFIDVVWGAVGYLWSLRLTDSHLRSTEPSTLGWVAALLCYEPFSRSVFPAYFAYGGGPGWGHWWADLPLAGALWGGLILGLTAVYTWATVSFGLRFSNLTHRGIITSGPYRWLRHPAYLSKNLSWWLISMPFMVSTHWTDSLRLCAMLLALNGVYWLRARTEDRHLRQDPVYQAYASALSARQRALWQRLAGRWRAAAFAVDCASPMPVTRSRLPLSGKPLRPAPP